MSYIACNAFYARVYVWACTRMCVSVCGLSSVPVYVFIPCSYFAFCCYCFLLCVILICCVLCMRVLYSVSRCIFSHNQRCFAILIENFLTDFQHVITFFQKTLDTCIYFVVVLHHQISAMLMRC